MGWIVSALGSAVTGHVQGRDEGWWTGSNSLWGQLTGGGSDRADHTNVRVTTPRGDGGMKYIWGLAIAFIVLNN